MSSRRGIQLFENCGRGQGQEPNPPFDTPSFVVPLQNPGLFQNYAKVACALGMEGVRVWPGENGCPKAGSISVVLVLDVSESLMLQARPQENAWCSNRGVSVLVPAVGSGDVGRSPRTVSVYATLTADRLFGTVTEAVGLNAI